MVESLLDDYDEHCLLSDTEVRRVLHQLHVIGSQLCLFPFLVAVAGIEAGTHSTGLVFDIGHCYRR
jgi:hypothetical protein